jgi:hypothetical protein
MRIADFGGEGYDITTIDTFGWYGEDIRTNPDFTPLDLIDLAEELEATQKDATSLQAQLALPGMIKRQLRMIIHPGDFDKFWSIAKEKRIGPETLMVVMEKVIEYITGRPTQQQSDSGNGLRNTTTSSESTRNAPVSPLSALEERVAEREMSGRPDLRLALVNIAEHRNASVG